MLDNPVKPTEVRVGNPIDLTMVPLEALSPRTRDLVGEMLNHRRIFTSEDGYFRDWRGVFDVVGVPKSYLPLVSTNPNPTGCLLKLWENETHHCKRGANLAELQSVLGCIDRWDILDDTSKMFERDAEQYLMKEQKRVAKKTQAAESRERIDCVDSDIITKDDTHDHKQQYDAFILYADADIEFATKMIDRLEARGMLLCLKDRDILGGSSFEHEVISRLISERCRRLVVIISNAFLESPLHDFTVTFAQALQIEKKARKVIPCVYDECRMPPHLQYTHRMDYQRAQNLYNFWDKLADSIRETPVKSAVRVAEREESMRTHQSHSRRTVATAPQPIPKLVVEEPTKPTVKVPTTEQETGVGSLKKSHSLWDMFFGSSQKRDKLSGSTSQLSISDITPSSSPKKTSSSPLGLIKRHKQQSFGASSSVPTTSTLATDLAKEEKTAKPKKKWYKPIGRKVATAM